MAPFSTPETQEDEGEPKGEPTNPFGLVQIAKSNANPIEKKHFPRVGGWEEQTATSQSGAPLNPMDNFLDDPYANP
jgi:hypothetical protein